jgi:hypothetical protein
VTLKGEPSRTFRIWWTIAFGFVAGLSMTVAFWMPGVIDPGLEALGAPPRDVLAALTTRYLVATSLGNLMILLLACCLLWFGDASSRWPRATTAGDAWRLAVALGTGFAAGALGVRGLALWMALRNASYWEAPMPGAPTREEYLALIRALPASFAVAVGTSVMLALAFGALRGRTTRFAALASAFAVAASMSLLELWLGPWPAMLGIVAAAAVLVSYLGLRPRPRASPAA